jgi:inorganic pyrophosphatase
MDSLKFLGKTVTVKVDRPLGSRHPELGFLYLLNYGYLPGVKASDGEELDAYILGIFEPVNQFVGKCIAVVHRIEEDDDKLIVVPGDKSYTDDQIKALTEFVERSFVSIIIRDPWSTPIRPVIPPQQSGG